MTEKMQWFFRKGHKELGPFSARQLRRMADESVVSPDTLVRRHIDDKWIRARKVRGLFPTSDGVNAPPIPLVANSAATPNQSTSPKPPSNGCDARPLTTAPVSDDPSSVQPNQRSASSAASLVGKKIIIYVIKTLAATAITTGIVWSIQTAIKQHQKDVIRKSLQNIKHGNSID